MIPRYSTAIMESIWDTETKYKIWLEIEILACEAMEKIGKIIIIFSIAKTKRWIQSL